jgi:hypothetical protein
MTKKTICKQLILALVLCTGAISCKDTKFSAPSGKKKSGGGDAKGSNSETFAGAKREPYQTDIIYLLDTSDSMKDKIKRVLDNLNSQTNDFLNKNKDLDYQIIVVTNADFTVTGDKIGRINQFIGSNGALSAAVSVISEGKKTENGLAIRPTAVKELVIVSDDDSDLSADDFLKWMDANPTIAHEVHVNGIVKLNKISCGIISSVSSDAGKQYIALANNDRTKGFIGDICKGDWANIFQNLGSQLSKFRTKPRVTVQLKGKPSGIDQISVTLNGAQLDKTKYQYDVENNKIIINAETTENDQIVVTYN